MRIWSIHPCYLDSKGLLALWREALLAKHVLEGKTKGYKNHPQLNRFKAADDPLSCINQYLADVYAESLQRGYHFNKDKINRNFQTTQLSVTDGQLAYESQHLLNKLAIRDQKKYMILKQITLPIPHPMFDVIKGDIENWEIVG